MAALNFLTTVGATREASGARGTISATMRMTRPRRERTKPPGGWPFQTTTLTPCWKHSSRKTQRRGKKYTCRCHQPRCGGQRGGCLCHAGRGHRRPFASVDRKEEDGAVTTIQGVLVAARTQMLPQIYLSLSPRSVVSDEVHGTLHHHLPGPHPHVQHHQRGEGGKQRRQQWQTYVKEKRERGEKLREVHCGGVTANGAASGGMKASGFVLICIVSGKAG